MINDVEINGKWTLLKHIDIKKPGKYLLRYSNKTYKDCIQILDISDSTWHNDLWVFINGSSHKINKWMLNNMEFCGPVKFNN